MLAQQAEQCAAQAQAEQHKETREMVDAHLEGLGWAEHSHKPFMIMTDPREPWPGEERVGQRRGPGAVQLDWKVRASCYGARFHGEEGTSWRMNRRAQKQIHVLAISRGLATSVEAHAGLELPHLLPPCVPGPALPL